MKTAAGAARFKGTTCILSWKCNLMLWRCFPSGCLKCRGGSTFLLLGKYCFLWLHVLQCVFHCSLQKISKDVYKRIEIAIWVGDGFWTSCEAAHSTHGRQGDGLIFLVSVNSRKNFPECNFGVLVLGRVRVSQGPVLGAGLLLGPSPATVWALEGSEAPAPELLCRASHRFPWFHPGEEGRHFPMLLQWGLDVEEPRGILPAILQGWRKDRIPQALTTSQNHRTVGVGRDLKRSCSLKPHY